MKRGARRWAALQGGFLALLSIGVGLAACEAALRLFHPRYALAARQTTEVGPAVRPGGMLRMMPGGAPRPLRDAWRRSYWRWFNPDTHVEHYVIHNNLGGRQSRDFTSDSLKDTVNIAFFGDSFAQNIHMPAQYSFTEPLDYLLNAQAYAGDQHGLALARPLREPRFNVLNFGHLGWGLGREYLRWRDMPLRRQLNHVFYLSYYNDLADLAWATRVGIVRLDESGEVLEGGTYRTPAWKRFLSRWHLTYLGIDVWLRLAAGRNAPDSAEQGVKPQRVGEGIGREDVPVEVVFDKLLRRWQREVEADGGVFHVVILPARAHGGFWATKTDLLAEFNVVDLRHCFRALIPDFRKRDWRFANDPHWNPAANMVAATCFYRHLEDGLGWAPASDETLAHMRHDYYQAFLDSPVWDGERYAPAERWARKSPASGATDRSAGEAIVAKYLALEVAHRMEEQWLEAVRAARAAGPVATSVWNVYVNLSEDLLVYVKTPCPPGWRLHDGDDGARFMLHVVPFTLESLPANRARFGFDNLDGGPFSRVHRTNGECVWSVPLPYPVAMITTGQFTERSKGDYDNLWSVRFRMPLARSVWDVYASGRGLEYVKKPCDQADTEARFFLHVHPLRPARPARPAQSANARRGYANLDFEWSGKGVVEDGACRVSATLPDFPIAFVDTGQFRGGIVPRRLWSARIDLEEEAKARPPW